jgi:hypothetical protein
VVAGAREQRRAPGIDKTTLAEVGQDGAARVRQSSWTRPLPNRCSTAVTDTHSCGLVNKPEE